MKRNFVGKLQIDKKVFLHIIEEKTKKVFLCYLDQFRIYEKKRYRKCLIDDAREAGLRHGDIVIFKKKRVGKIQDIKSFRLARFK